MHRITRLSVVALVLTGGNFAYAWTRTAPDYWLALDRSVAQWIALACVAVVESRYRDEDQWYWQV
jgi:hypothetical protein